MTADEFFAQTVADAVKEAIAPLVARIDLTIEEVAKKLKVSKRTVTRMVESKRLPEPEGKGKARRWLARDVHIAKEERAHGHRA